MENLTNYNDDIYIAAADYVMANAPDFSDFSPFDYLSDFKFATYYPTTLPEDVQEFQNGKYVKITNYMIQKGYVYYHSLVNYELTDLAREMKRKGGYYKYWEYSNRRENAVFENLEINLRTANATERAAVATERSVKLNLIYVIITAVIMIVSIYTCNLGKASVSDPKTLTISPATVPPKLSLDTAQLKKKL